MVSLPPRERGGIRMRGGNLGARGEGRRVMVSLPPRERGGIQGARGHLGARSARELG